MLEFLRMRWSTMSTEADIMNDDKRDVNNKERVASTAHNEPFLTLYRHHVTSVYSYIYSRIRNRADAEDLTEQVFTEALEGMERYEEPGKPAAWLFTIAHRRVVDHYRSRHEHIPFDEALDSPLDGLSPEGHLLRREQLEQLSRLVVTLDEEQQELLQLRFVAGLTYREIGEVLGSSGGAVKIAIYRLLDRLRALWPAHAQPNEHRGRQE